MTSSTVFIANIAVQLENKYGSHEPPDELYFAILNDIQKRRVIAKVRYLLAKNEILPVEVQTKAEQLMEEPLLPYLTTDDDGADNDPILLEALSMARELIVGRMAQEGLPPPRGLDTHAKALVDGAPQLRERARLRVEARYKAAAEVLREMI